MSQKYSNLSHLLGKWSELLGHLFFVESIREFSNTLKTTKSLPFDDVYGDDDYFKTIREMPFGEIKALYIKEFADAPTQQLREIENQLFTGFNLPVSVQPDFNWLTKQGIVIFPRYYTWGTPTSLHKEWSLFTDEALTIILKKDPKIIVCTNNPEVREFLLKRIPTIKIICHSPVAWIEIGNYVKEVFKTEINWAPKI